MIDPKTGGPHTAHTTNPVPCILVGKGFENTKMRAGGRLADVAPTLLGLMQVEQPATITGVDLAKESAQQVVATHAIEGATGVEALQILVSEAKKFFAAASAAEGENSRDEAEQVAAIIGLPNLADQVQSAVDSAPRNTALSPAEVRGAVAQYEIELKEQLEHIKAQMQAAQ
jgi:arylsulfatase A-like enzyme